MHLYRPKVCYLRPKLCYLFFGLKCRFWRLWLRHFEPQELQHLLSGVALGHLLTGAHPFCALPTHSHLYRQEGRGEVNKP